jgi:hypothetical protein
VPRGRDGRSDLRTERGRRWHPGLAQVRRVGERVCRRGRCSSADA